MTAHSEQPIDVPWKSVCKLDSAAEAQAWSGEVTVLHGAPHEQTVA